MPTYDYICRACEHQFELFQSMNDPVKRKCPKCGKPKLERLIGTGAGVIFKGSGFYQTDYRSEGYKKAAEAESKPAGDKAGEKSGPKASEKSGPKAGEKGGDTKPNSCACGGPGPCASTPESKPKK